jgi:hypothetical protein
VDSQASSTQSTLPSAAASSSAASAAAVSTFEAQRLYLVEAILDKRGTRHRAEYLVKWVGVEATQWVPYAVVQAVDFKVWNKFNVAYKQKINGRTWRRLHADTAGTSTTTEQAGEEQPDEPM